MNEGNASISTEHFEALYARSSDPWRFETSDYEKRKYALTLEALGQRRFERGFELGCSIGVLTALLAERCDTILGADCAPAAIALARRKRAASTNTTFAQMRAPDEWPEGRFDLIVLSEVLYFLSTADLRRVASLCARSLAPNRTIVLVNYLGPTDASLSGDAAAAAFLCDTADWAQVVHADRQDDFRLEVLRSR